MSAKPDPFRSLTKIIKGIQERLVRLENAPRFFNTGLEVVDPGQLIQSGSITIPADGLLLVDGGDVIMLNESMVEVFRIGVMPNGDRGVRLKRSDGSVAFEVRDTLGLGVQSVAVRDASGALIAGTGLFQNGLGSPWIPIEWTPVDYTSGALAQSTSAATFTATHEHRGYKQNNVFKPQFMVKCSDGTTAAEVRLYSVTGAAALAAQDLTPLTITVPAGTTSFSLFEFAQHVYLPGSYGLPVTYQIQARVTAGAGSVSVAPVRSVGTRDGLSG